IVPDLEVHDLRPADADGDAQHFRARYPLTEGGGKTGASLLDETEMKSRSVGNRLDVIRVVQIGCRCGNRGMLSFIQAWDGLREGWRAEIEVFFASVASPPTGIHPQLLQVGEAPRLRHP